jgi:lipopolysaccharide biosynthesis glycosyltransferase
MRTAIVTLATKDYLVGMSNLYLSLQSFDHDLTSIDFVCISDCQKEFEFVGNKVIKYENLVDLSKLGNLELSDRFSITIHKFQIFDMLQKYKYDRLIFLDSDILCVSTITSLLESNFQCEPFLAVKDYSCGRYYGEAINEIGLNIDFIFNTGLLVLNKQILEFLDFTTISRILELDAISYDGGDQGLFNYIFQKLKIPVTFLPVSYNDALDFNYPISFTFPKLVHFTGPKPWISENKIKFYDKRYYVFYKYIMKFYKNYPRRTGIRFLIKKQINNCLLLLCIIERIFLKILYRIFKQ